MKSTASDTAPRLYVGTYAKYNDGSIQGAWIDLDGHDKETFYQTCRELHADEEDPEFMFQDFEGFPGEFYGESGCNAALWEWLELDEDEREMLAMYADAIGYNKITIEQARDSFIGKYDSGADYAEECAECHKTDELPNWIVIDWEASWENNLRHDYSTATDNEGKLWIFQS